MTSEQLKNRLNSKVESINNERKNTIMSENVITTGALNFIYTENNGVGSGISLTDALPVSDEVGKAYSTENYVFDFMVYRLIELRICLFVIDIEQITFNIIFRNG